MPLPLHRLLLLACLIPALHQLARANPPASEGKKSPDGNGPARTDLLGDPLPEGAIARIGTTRLRDNASTTVIAFSPDGGRLAYGNENGLVHVCEAADGKPLFDFKLDDPRFLPVTE